jgi:hypothetical protein
MEYETTLMDSGFLVRHTQTVVLEGNSSSTNPVASGVEKIGLRSCVAWHVVDVYKEEQGH